MSLLARNQPVCFIALLATLVFSLPLGPSTLFAADVAEIEEEVVIAEEAPSQGETVAAASEEAPAEGETPPQEKTPEAEDGGFWHGPWPWIIGGGVVAGGAAAVIIASQDDDGGGGDGVPVLSNLQAPAVVYRGQNYVYTFDYSDPDGDITQLHYKKNWPPPWGSGTSIHSAAELGISGTSGTVVFERYCYPDAFGDFNAEIWVEDAKHHTSNILTADHLVREQAEGDGG